MTELFPGFEANDENLIWLLENIYLQSSVNIWRFSGLSLLIYNDGTSLCFDSICLEAGAPAGVPVEQPLAEVESQHFISRMKYDFNPDGLLSGIADFKILKRAFKERGLCPHCVHRGIQRLRAEALPVCLPCSLEKVGKFSTMTTWMRNQLFAATGLMRASFRASSLNV